VTDEGKKWIFFVIEGSFVAQLVLRNKSSFTLVSLSYQAKAGTKNKKREEKFVKL
jgi:hypothetical protein